MDTSCLVLCAKVGLTQNLGITIPEDDLTDHTSGERTFMLQAPAGEVQHAHDEIRIVASLYQLRFLRSNWHACLVSLTTLASPPPFGQGLT